MCVDRLKKTALELTVLYIEDHKEIKEFFGRFLSRCFKKVVQSSFEKALYLYAKEPYDLVIIDIDEYSIDKIAFIECIYKVDSSQAIIIMSEQTNSDAVQNLLNSGVCAVIRKPIWLDAAVKTLLNVCKQLFIKTKLSKNLQELEKLNAVMSHIHCRIKNTTE